jgi:hypothetical protein
VTLVFARAVCQPQRADMKVAKARQLNLPESKAEQLADALIGDLVDPG